jgi:surface antigen|tara:strand:+ start:670 stop:1158 length:489 start_codon:yes stop_codon:yes gene_type:complete
MEKTMKRRACYLAIGFIALALAACQQGGQKQTLGTLLGAVGGAVAGSQIGKGRGQLVAVAAGTLLGSFLGSEIGKSLDRADRIAMENTTQRTLESAPSGNAVSWRNPDSGHSGTVTPQPSYQNASGNYCREYQQTITVGGRTETAYGTACRQPDGSWKIVNG